MLLVFCVASILGCAAESVEAPSRVVKSDGVQAPDFELKNREGVVERLSQHQGKRPVLITFWATWCPYCRQEVPMLNKLRAQYAEDDLAIMGINIRESREKVQAFEKRLRLNYEVLFDVQGQVSQVYGVQGLPTSFLIDQDGQAVMRGHQIEPNWLEVIQALVDAK